MQISVETTTQTASIFTASFSGSSTALGASIGQGDGKQGPVAAPSLLEVASKKAEEDAVVIAALQDAVEKGRSDDEEDKDGALAKMEEYRQAAGKLKTALGEGEETQNASNISYESAAITTTTVHAEHNGKSLTAEFVSFERVSYDSATGLSARSASASNIEGDFGSSSFSAQSASVSSLYMGRSEQVGNLLASFA
ncbi:MAG: hypothetical protein HWE23_14785 [Rhodobacteraceae bacterium]|nr:hypothetical protein [Paracoccaceae bacterium]